MNQLEALKILKTGSNVFLTGEPGSGKTYTINQYVSYLKNHGIYPAITASTGIAGTHIGGMTIHSWSGIGINKSLSPIDLDRISTTKHLVKRLTDAKVLIIDEISMLSAKTFSLIDLVLKEVRRNDKPFGGLQVVCVGDFFQLPPVSKDGVEDFAFESEIWKELEMIVCYLDEQYRQDDEKLLSVLKGIRNKKILNKHIEYIKSRIDENHLLPKEITKLFPHNINVEKINEEELNAIKQESYTFFMSESGKEGLIIGLKKSCLSPEILVLKKGALVMFTKNSRDGRFQNGTLGEIISFDNLTGLPIVRTYSGQDIKVETMDWTIEEEGKVKAKISQLPLRLAWAITIHKSQGMTFDNAFMDLSDVFEYGQGYVALSRVRNLNGLFLAGVNKRVFEVHPKILDTDQNFRKFSSDAVIYFDKMDEDEIKRMHLNFIRFCGGYFDSTKVKQKLSKKKTEDITLELFLETKNIEKIAKKRGLTKETVLSHIEKLFKSNLVSKDDLIKIVPKKTLKDKQKIKSAFTKYGPQLKKVFESLDGKYSYFDLRLMRMILDL